MLHHLREYAQIQWERGSIDSASVPFRPLGGPHTGPNPTDCGKLGCNTICPSTNTDCLS